jgi:hypothetical protein
MMIYLFRRRRPAYESYRDSDYHRPGAFISFNLRLEVRARRTPRSLGSETADSGAPVTPSPVETLIPRRTARRRSSIRAKACSCIEIRARSAIVIRGSGERGAPRHQPSHREHADNDFHKFSLQDSGEKLEFPLRLDPLDFILHADCMIRSHCYNCDSGSVPPPPLFRFLGFHD